MLMFHRLAAVCTTRLFQLRQRARRAPDGGYSTEGIAVTAFVRSAAGPVGSQSGGFLAASVETVRYQPGAPQAGPSLGRRASRGHSKVRLGVSTRLALIPRPPGASPRHRADRHAQPSYHRPSASAAHSLRLTPTHARSAAEADDPSQPGGAARRSIGRVRSHQRCAGLPGSTANSNHVGPCTADANRTTSPAKSPAAATFNGSGR